MPNSQKPIRLDDLYKMVAHIYSDKNSTRSSSSTFAHFVEVCGMLTIHDRKKKREGIDVTDALCKALGWYFPLLAKMRVKSAEQLIFRKFPRVCPYCRSAPHKETECKLVRGTQSTVSHVEVSQHFAMNWSNRPDTLDTWQLMFQSIYPRSLEEHGRSTIGLLEELGELAEAVRVGEQHPKYFLGEAADTFSYLMGIANEHSVRLAQDGQKFSFQSEFLSRYPGLCIQCGSKLCVCPAIPEATVGRMAKEINISENENPFIVDPGSFAADGKIIAHQVLESLGGHAGLTAKLPFDRGDTNKALVEICLKIADALENENQILAETLRAEALKISTLAEKAGSPRKATEIEGILKKLEATWAGLSQQLKTDIRKTEGLVGEIGDILDTVRVLFVFCSPVNEDALRVSGEMRVINESIKAGDSKISVIVKPLPAATATDFRRELLGKKYDIVHFSGHADSENLIFEDENGNAHPVSLSSISDAIRMCDTVKVVILNACESAKNILKPIGAFTIGMDDSIEDEAALEFSRGFYDAIVLGKSIPDAFAVGINAVQMAGHSSDQIRLISDSREIVR